MSIAAQTSDTVTDPGEFVPAHPDCPTCQHPGPGWHLHAARDVNGCTLWRCTDGERTLSLPRGSAVVYEMRPDAACLFESAGPHSIKLRCRICGRTGYETRNGLTGEIVNRHSWQLTCMRGHRPCPRCGRMLSVLRNGSARTHGRCPVSTGGEG